MTLEEAINHYVWIRDKKGELEKAHKAKLARLSETLRALEAKIMEEFNKDGVESAKTSAGTAYRSVKTSVKVHDPDAYMAFIRDSDDWALLETRASKSAVEAYLAAHGELPPGCSITKFATIIVNRPNRPRS